MLEHNENLGSSVDLIRIKLFLIKPITVAEKQRIAARVNRCVGRHVCRRVRRSENWVLIKLVVTGTGF